MKTVVTAGALDTKGADYEFLVRSVRSHGVNVLTVDFGVLGDPPFIPDVTNAEVARAGGVELGALRQAKDKSLAMRVMAEGLSCILSRLREEGRLDGVCGMDGSGGTTILSAGVRGLPIGIPKLLVSTVADHPPLQVPSSIAQPGPGGGPRWWNRSRGKSTMNLDLKAHCG